MGFVFYRRSFKSLMVQSVGNDGILMIYYALESAKSIQEFSP